MSAVEVRALPGRGRGLVTTRQVEAGEAVLVEEPLLLTVSQEAKDNACAHCLCWLERCTGKSICNPATTFAICSLSSIASVCCCALSLRLRSSCRCSQVSGLPPGSFLLPSVPAAGCSEAVGACGCHLQVRRAADVLQPNWQRATLNQRRAVQP